MSSASSKPATMSAVRLRTPINSARSSGESSRIPPLCSNRFAPLNSVLGATHAGAADNVADAPTPHVPICPNCRQEGREHKTPPEAGRHFMCAEWRCALDGATSGILGAPNNR